MKNKISIFKVLSLIVLATFFQYCKKDHDVSPIIDHAPTTGTRTQFTLDSIYLYAHQVYLWNTQLPSYDDFSPRRYTSRSGNDLDKFNEELYDITQYAKNPETGLPYEYVQGGNYPKYSYIDENTFYGSALSSLKSNVDLEGNGFDFGFALTGIVNSDDVYIRYVNPGSPADEKGLKRGYRVTKINGTSIDGNTSTSFIEDAFLQSTMKLTVVKNDGSAANITLSQTSYDSNPVYKETILTEGSKKVGYLAFARFSNLNNAQTALDNAFTDFANAGVSDLVVDLRYNGGGYVSTAEYMCNLIAPSSLNGKVMYIEHYNDLMRSGKATILSNQIVKNDNGETIGTYADLDYSEAKNTYKFAKEGSLQSVKNVYFIVTGNTASASELVINNLRPYLNVKIIGTRSYGKPVGFFPITINGMDIYMSNFQSRNANNEGDYFQGFTPDIDAVDDVSHDFGDPDEICLSKALAYVSNGSIATANTKMVVGGNKVSASAVKIRNISPDNGFKGMIEDRLESKLKEGR